MYLGVYSVCISYVFSIVFSAWSGIWYIYKYIVTCIYSSIPGIYLNTVRIQFSKYSVVKVYCTCIYVDLGKYSHKYTYNILVHKYVNIVFRWTRWNTVRIQRNYTPRYTVFPSRDVNTLEYTTEYTIEYMRIHKEYNCRQNT
jgi:hypothetical protein